MLKVTFRNLLTWPRTREMLILLIMLINSPINDPELAHSWGNFLTFKEFINISRVLGHGWGNLLTSRNLLTFPAFWAMLINSGASPLTFPAFRPKKVVTFNMSRVVGQKWKILSRNLGNVKGDAIVFTETREMLKVTFRNLLTWPRTRELLIMLINSPIYDPELAHSWGNFLTFKEFINISRVLGHVKKSRNVTFNISRVSAKKRASSSTFPGF